MTDAEMVNKYLQAVSVVYPTTDGRIKIVNKTSSTSSAQKLSSDVVILTINFIAVVLMYRKCLASH